MLSSLLFSGEDIRVVLVLAQLSLEWSDPGAREIAISESNGGRGGDASLGRQTVTTQSSYEHRLCPYTW